MKKNIIIIGPPRSGKSTLAQMIVKRCRGFSLISVDNFRTSYSSVCREDCRVIDSSVPIRMSYRYLEECAHYENSINYVLESCDYLEEAIEKSRNELIIVFLGYSGLTVEELFDNIRKYDNERDWTSLESDGMLRLFCEAFLRESKRKEEIAKEKDYWYVDTSKNRKEVLEKTFMKIVEILEE